MTLGFRLVLTAVLVLGFALSAGAAEAKKDAAASKTLVVTSDKMEADNATRLVVFKGNVEAQEDFFLCSDELRVTYGERNEVADIVAVGNVRIFQEGKTARSHMAVYDRVKRTLVLTGSPVVEQCADTVTGDKIIFYIEEDRALVQSSSGGRVRAVIMPDKKCPEADGGGGASSSKGPTKGLKGGGEDSRCTGAR